MDKDLKDYPYDVYSQDLIDNLEWNKYKKRKTLNHEHLGDALFEILEQLYCSENEIDEDVLRENFLWLCDKLGVETHFAQNLENICVMHKSRYRGYENKIRLEYEKKMDDIKKHSIELKKQICDEIDEVDLTKTTHALRQICEKAGAPMYWGQRATIVRETWRLIGRSELIKLAMQHKGNHE